MSSSRFDFKCKGEIFEWRGPAPFYFVALDSKTAKIVKERAKELSYGWGVIHIHGQINKVDFATAIIPKDGTYFVPVKDAVRKRLNIGIGDTVIFHFSLGKASTIVR